MTFEKALELASKKILLPGYKPEDYNIIDEGIPIRLAKLIVSEAHHILKMHEGYKVIRMERNKTWTNLLGF